ncbi:MAG: hypothetical protein IJK74_05945 [Bacteroidales bacterium]|jgi:hypothetical protein|nr:hypothetical protein [Bacteroidales bacterium]
MTIQEYKDKFQELAEQLEKEHGGYKSISIGKESFIPVGGFESTYTEVTIQF